MGGELITKILSPGSARKAKRETKRAKQLQREQQADIRRQQDVEDKRRASRARLLETRKGGLGVTLFMSELGVQRATTLGGTT